MWPAASCKNWKRFHFTPKESLWFSKIAPAYVGKLILSWSAADHKYEKTSVVREILLAGFPFLADKSYSFNLP